MPSIKQIQSRLLTKKNTLNTVNINMKKAEKTNNKIAQRKLSQEIGTLGRDIKKLERQLIAEKKVFMEKKALNPYQGNIWIVPLSGLDSKLNNF